MADQQIGKLTAAVVADISGFKAQMQAAGFAAEGFANQMTAAGQKFSDAGVRLNATNKLVADFNGILDKRRAEEYAAAVEKIGGAARLTAADQARVNQVMQEAIAHYDKLKDAPAHFVALEQQTRKTAEATDVLGGTLTRLVGAFTVGNLIDTVIEKIGECGKAAIETASHLTDLSAKTGLSLDTLQRMAYVAAQTGTTVDTFADVVFKMGINVADGGKKVEDALAKMGLSWKQFKELTPEEQFKTIIANLDKFTSAQERNAAMVAIGGKAVGNAVAGMVDNYAKLAGAAEVAGDAQVKAAAAGAREWNAYWANVTTRVEAALGDLVLEAKLYKSDFLEVTKAEFTAPDIHKALAAIAEARAAMDAARADFARGFGTHGEDIELPVPKVPAALTEQLKEALNTLNHLEPAVLANVRAGLELGKSNDDITKSTGVAAEVIDLYKKRLQDAKDAATKAAAELKRLNAAIDEFHSKIANATVDAATMVNRIGGVVKALDPMDAAMRAIANAHRDLGAQVTDATLKLLREGQTGAQAFETLKKSGYAVDDMKDSIVTLGNEYESFTKKVQASVDSGGAWAQLSKQVQVTKLHLTAAMVAANATAAAHAKLAPETAKAAQEMLNLGMKSEEVFKALKEQGLVTDADKDKIEAMSKATVGLEQTLGSLTQAFAQLAQVSGGAFGGVAQGIATTIALMSAGVQAAKGMQSGWSQIKTAQNTQETVAGYSQMAAGALSAAAAIGQATQAGSEAHRVMSGAATGAAIGTQILPGWGTAVGAAVGAIVGAIRGSKSNAYKLGQEWGVTFSDGLQKTIDDEKKSLFHGDLDSAALHNLKAIIDEAGGLTQGNLAFYERKLLDVFVKLSQGTMTAAQAAQVLNDNFASFLKAGTDANGVWDANLKQIIQAAKDAHLEIQGITDAIAAQQQKLEGATVNLTAATGAAAAQYTDLSKQVADARKALDDLVSSGASQDEITKATQTLTDAQGKLAKVTVTSQDEFDRLSRITLAAFNGLVSSGVDVVTAMNQIGPGIDNLVASAQAFGLSGNAAFDQLSRWRTLTADNAPLLAQVGSLTDMMAALTNLGGMTADTFADMQAQGAAAFDKLTAAGFTTNEALVQMKPFLETVIKLHKDQGYAIDENTQKLIAQATAQGILTGEELDTNDILIEGLSAMIEAIGGKIPEAWKKATDAAKKSAQDSTDALNKTAKAGQDAATTTQNAWDNVRITVPVQYDMPAVPGGDNPPRSTEPVTPSAAYEGFFKMPTTIRVGDDPMGEGEFVLHKRTLENLVAASAAGRGADLSAALAALPAPVAVAPDVLAGAPAPPVLASIGSVPTRGGAGTVIVTLDRRFLAQCVVPELEGEVRRLGFGK